jgi:hypothetical protein
MKVQRRRHDFALVTEYSKGNPSNKIKKSAKRIFIEYKAHCTDGESNSICTSEFLDTLQQKPNKTFSGYDPRQLAE